jgi:sugar phosphate isomerase/epimerase
LIELGKLADRYGVTLALSAGLAPIAALERAIRRAGCPWFGVEIDPVAILRDEWSIDEVFSRIGPLIRHARVHDASLGAGGRTVPAIVGKGGVDWNEFLARLDDAGYAGWLTIDPSDVPDRPGGIAAALRVLRGIV